MGVPKYRCRAPHAPTTYLVKLPHLILQVIEHLNGYIVTMYSQSVRFVVGTLINHTAAKEICYILVW